MKYLLQVDALLIQTVDQDFSANHLIYVVTLIRELVDFMMEQRCVA